MYSDSLEVERQMRCVVLCEKCQGAFPLWSIGSVYIPSLDRWDFNCPVCNVPTSSKEFDLYERSEH